MARNQLIAKPITLEEIAVYYKDSEAALRLFFSLDNPRVEQFLGSTPEELDMKLNERIEELGRLASLSLLATLEALFRTDYKERIKKRKKDCLSKALKKIHNIKATKASLEDDILQAWKENTNDSSQLISHLKGAYKYRHWLAHGRYWSPKMGRPDYDYSEIYQLVETTINSFPFEDI